MADDGVPAGCRLVVGAIGVNADFVTLLEPEQSTAPASARCAAAAQPAFAPLNIKPWVPREDPTADGPASGPTLRQRIKADEDVVAAQPRRGFIARLFGRSSRG
jgi:hypothetical protein